MQKYWGTGVYRGIYHELNFRQPGFYKKSNCFDLNILHGGYCIHDFTVTHCKR